MTCDDFVTKSRRPLRRILPLCALALLLSVPCTPAAHAEALPPNVVAKVADRELTFDAFCRVVIQHAQRDLLETRHGPRAILDKLCEERLVMQWCRKHNLVVSNDDVDRKWGQLSRQIQAQSGGDKTLRDMVVEQGTSIALFKQKLAHEMRKELVANKRLGGSLPKGEAARFRQTKLVIDKMMGEARIEYGLPVVGHTTPVAMPRDQVCRVNGEPITRTQFGKALVLHMPSDEVRDWLDQECKIGIMATEGVALAPEALKEELDHMRKLWPLERTVQREVAWMDLTFDERFKAVWKTPVDDVAKNRFLRGLFGLVRRFRPTVTEAEVRKDYEERKHDKYGEHLVVTDVAIKFMQARDPFGVGGNDPRQRRTRQEALREIRNVLSQVSAGKPFDSIRTAILARQDPTFSARKIRVYNRDRAATVDGKKTKGVRDHDRMIWERVKKLRDKELSSPIESLSEVHVYRREGLRPARSYAEIRELLLEFRARNKAGEWLGERLRDPNYVRIRWPLPQRGKIERRRRTK